MPESEKQQKLAAAFAAIDTANAADPRLVAVDGEEVPSQWLYGRRMSEVLDRYLSEASIPLRLAARAQHLERWRSPRDSYPMDREGYLRWRADLKKFHAARAGEILRGAGFDEEVIDRVAFLLQKKRLKRDDDTQALEDVICVVFLKYYAAEFAAEHPHEKVIDILHKTLRKMSDRGRDTALEADLPAGVRSMVLEAMEIT
ncbi:MAG: DUF4202 domain-containing protein [Lewinella sp.]